VEQTRAGFDLITFFQVVEHLPDPVTTLKQATALLNPGGYISVAVPSADGVYRLVPWDPHQWPPHHISRWHLKDFGQLARAVPLRLVESGGDILVGSQLEYFWNLHNRLAPALGEPPRWGRETLPAVISFLYRKTGMKFVFPKWGCSIYACFQKI
jgi:SAM-dependent methyltransferase